MPSFYELTTELRDLEAELELSDDALNDEQLTARLNSVALEAEQKCSAVGGWIKSLDALADARSAEIKRLQALNKVTDNLASRLRGYIKAWMQTSGAKTLKTKLATFSLRKPSTRLVVDESKVLEWTPEFFGKALELGALVERYEVNKTLLKQVPGYLEQAGVCEVEGEESLAIK